MIEAARRGVRAFGGDISVTGVRRAASFGATEGVADRATFVACAAEELPFRSDTFDACSAIAIPEHVDDDVAALTELARVVRDGARVWLTVPLAYHYVPPPAWPWYWLHDRRMGHERHYDEDRMVTAARSAGLEHLATSYTGHPVKVAQFALDRLARLSGERARRSLWWRLERADQRASRRRWWALQLHVVLARPGALRLDRGVPVTVAPS